MEEEFILEETGLGRKEARIYLILIKKGESTAVSLAKAAGLHRRTAYDTLDKLHKKGLINIKIRKYVKYYIPVNPESILGILKEKQAIIKRILPKLMSEFNANKRDIVVSVFEGIEVMKRVLLDAIKECKKKKDTVLMTGAGLRTPGYMKYAFPHYVKMLEKINWKLLEPNIPRVIDDMKKWNINIKNKNCRFLSKKYFSPLGILVYGDKTIIMLLEGEPILIQITGKGYAKSFKTYFNLLWKLAK